jgi:hypothetical protein
MDARAHGHFISNQNLIFSAHLKFQIYNRTDFVIVLKDADRGA